MIARIKRTVRSCLRKCGYELIPYTPNRSLERRRMQFIRDHGISVVLDVGANVGQYAGRLRDAGYTGRIVSFEPLSKAMGELRRHVSADLNWECHQMALGEMDGLVEIHVAGNSVSSSILPINAQHVKSEPKSASVGLERVPIVRLDSIRSTLIKDSDKIYLKLDVQGYEERALLGARKTLDQVQVIEVELSLVPLYENQPLYRDVISLLEGYGFHLISLERGFTDSLTGHVLQVDGILARLL